jgi:foldase protein PrsA
VKKWILALSLTAGVLSLTACNNANGSDVVAETSAGDISKDDLYNAMKEKYGEQALQELLYEKVLAANYEVTDEELDAKLKEVKDQLGENFEMALLQYGYEDEDAFKESLKTSMLQEKAALKEIKVTDEEVKKYYDEQYKPQIKARHILVADEATANEVKSKLDAGEKFEDLAKQYSTDTASAELGGDLDWFGAGAMVPEFEEAAYALEVNAISAPVKSEFGYHIIQVTDKKEKEAFDKVKDEMEYQLKSSKLDTETVQSAMDRELKNAKVKITDKDLEGVIAEEETTKKEPSEEPAEK